MAKYAYEKNSMYIPGIGVTPNQVKIIMHTTPGGGPARSISLSFKEDELELALSIGKNAAKSALCAFVWVWDHEDTVFHYKSESANSDDFALSCL